MAARSILKRPRRGASAALAAVAVAIAAAVPIALAADDPPRGTTLEQRIVPAGSGDFRQLRTGPGEGYEVREDDLGTAQPGRKQRRRSIAYLGQLTDFQVVDEESPARVEFLDPLGPPVDSAWRPYEAMTPQIANAMIKQMNSLAGAAPNRSGGGGRRAMDAVFNTGDLIDNQQLNETRWLRTLLNGGTLDPNSGISPRGYAHPLCPPVGVPGAAEARRYTGVQDYDDYVAGPDPYFWDPDDPRGVHQAFPAYPGLMDEAQQPFRAVGLKPPSYIAIGNHDGLVQGNQAANPGFEEVATGCTKTFGTIGAPRQASFAPSLERLPERTRRAAAALRASGGEISARRATQAMLVPPDPARRFVTKPEFIEIFADGQADGNGFGLVDPDQRRASRGAAGYYSFSPARGLRTIVLDTLSEGGVTGSSSNGNVDDPQFRWLEDELRRATARDQLIMISSHHAIQSLTADVPDEAAGACENPEDPRPGCDLDPRDSSPVQLGDDLVELVHRYPHVVAWIAGHSHVNDITPYPEAGGGGFWMIRTAATIDWPQQSRLLEFFDNRDGTISIFGTIFDHASPVRSVAPGTRADGLSSAALASIGRTVAHNDLQKGPENCDPPCGEGTAEDRNVELLVDDPRRGDGGGGGGEGERRCGVKIRGTKGADLLLGDDRSERISGRAGDDRIRAKGGDDCVSGGPGDDRIGGGRGDDRLRGGRGSDLIHGRSGDDRISGGRGRDRIFGGGGDDRIDSRDGRRDVINCGRGRDLAIVDPQDVVRGCERVRVGRPGSKQPAD